MRSVDGNIPLTSMLRPPHAVLLATVTVAAASVIGGDWAQSTTFRVRVTASAEARQGGVAAIAATASPGRGSCTAVVRHSGGRTIALGRKRLVQRRASWTWRVPADAAVGRWSVTVACGSSGIGRAAISVSTRSVAARVVIRRSGFSQTPLTFREGTRVSYGLVLANESPDEAALGVTVTVNFVDGQNRLLGTDSNALEAVPANGVFYFGDEASTEIGGTVARVEPIIQIRESRRNTLPSLSATNVRTLRGEEGETRVFGELANTSSRTLSPIARISAVFFDSQGAIVGGGYTFPEAAIPPGTRQSFVITVFGVPASRIATVEVSVEPEFA